MFLPTCSPPFCRGQRLGPWIPVSKPFVNAAKRASLLAEDNPTQMTNANANTPLWIAILGSGKVGSTFAFQLVNVGYHDVTVVARPESARLHQLRRDGAVVDVRGRRADVRISEALEEDVAYDLVIVTLLDHQVDAILPSLQRSAAKSVLFMFNTFHPERLADAIGADRCAFGMPFVQAMLDGDGKLKSSIGAGRRKTILSDQRWVDLFNDAGLPAMREPNMPLWLRCHVPMCVAFESVAVAGERRGGGATWREAMMLARGVQAGFGLIKGIGHPIYPASKRKLDHRPAFLLAALLWSLSHVRAFRELLASRKAEAGFLVNSMVAAAPRSTTLVDVQRICVMKPESGIG